MPREAVVHQEIRLWVMVSQNGKWQKRAVKIGAMNDFEAVIAAGLEEATVVARNPQSVAGLPNSPAK